MGGNLPNGCNGQDYKIFRYNEDGETLFEIGTNSSLISISKGNYLFYEFKNANNQTEAKILVRLLINPTNLEYFFSDSCAEIITFDKNFNTSQVTKMNSMFEGCEFLISLDLNNFDTRQVTTMYSMFSGCDELKTLKIDNFSTLQQNSMIYLKDR